MIQLRLDTIRPRSLGPATGDIHAVLSGVAFPSADWNDFAIVIASEFVVTAFMLLVRRDFHATLRFMEGSEWLDFTRVENFVVLGIWHELEEARGNVGADELHRSALHVARQLHELPDANRFSDGLARMVRADRLAAFLTDPGSRVGSGP